MRPCSLGISTSRPPGLQGGLTNSRGNFIRRLAAILAHVDVAPGLVSGMAGVTGATGRSE